MSSTVDVPDTTVETSDSAPHDAVHGVVVSPLLSSFNASTILTPAVLDVTFVTVAENKNVAPPATVPGLVAIVSVLVGVLLPPPQLTRPARPSTTNAAAHARATVHI